MARKKVVTEEVVSTEAAPIEENQETNVVTEEVVSTEATTGEEAQASQEEEQEPKGEDQAPEEEPNPVQIEFERLTGAHNVLSEECEGLKAALSEMGEQLNRLKGDPLIVALNHIEDAEAALQEVIKQRKAQKKPTVSFSRCKKILSDTKKRLSAYVKN